MHIGLLSVVAVVMAGSVQAATKPTKFDLICKHDRVGTEATFWVDLDEKQTCEERRCDASKPWKALKVEERTLVPVQPQRNGTSSVWTFDRVNATAVWKLDQQAVGPWSCRVDRYTGPGAEPVF